jgi:hypothetical protein
LESWQQLPNLSKAGKAGNYQFLGSRPKAGKRNFIKTVDFFKKSCYNIIINNKKQVKK